MQSVQSFQQMCDNAKEANSNYPSTFPVAFVQYCIQNALPPQLFQSIIETAATLPRYVRVHRAWWDYLRQNVEIGVCEKYAKLLLSQQEQQQDLSMLFSPNQLNEAKKVQVMQRMLAQELHLALHQVSYVTWLPNCNCFALPSNVSLHSSHMYQLGFIIGMDAASMAAVLALQPRHGELILDVCCAPGMKLNLIADMIKDTSHATLNHQPNIPASPQLHEKQQKTEEAKSTPIAQSKASNLKSRGVVIGVDVSLDRLYTCRSIVRKHEYAYKLAMANSSSNFNDCKDVSLAHVNVNNNSNSNINQTNCKFDSSISSNVALFLADGCTFTLSAALHTLFVRSPPSQQQHQSVQEKCKTRCAVLHDNTGLTSHEQRKLQKLKAKSISCIRKQTSIDSKTVSGKRDRRSRYSTCDSCDSINHNNNIIANGTKNLVSADSSVKTQVHVVYAPKPVRQQLIHLHSNANSHLQSSSSFSLSSSSSIQQSKQQLLFDKVLVDAQCTHDGSLRHLCLDLPLVNSWKCSNEIACAAKQSDECVGVSNKHRMAHIHINNANNEKIKKALIGDVTKQHHTQPFTQHWKQQQLQQQKEQLTKQQVDATCDNNDNSDSRDCSNLFALQLELLRNGFAQLKVNGTLVYCTCSFAYAQNEKVVLHFIEQYNANSSQSHLKAVLIPPFSFANDSDDKVYDQYGKDSNHTCNTSTSLLKVYDELQCTLDSCKDFCNVVSVGAKLCKKCKDDMSNTLTQNDQQTQQQKMKDENANSNDNQHMYAGSRF